MTDITMMDASGLAGQRISGGQGDKAAKLAELDRLFLQVAAGQGGSGDYTKEKYDFPDESLEEVCARLAALQAGQETTE